jgi:hypothetical protein
VGLILGSSVYPALLQFGWQAPFVLSGGLGVAVAATCALVIPDVSDVPLLSPPPKAAAGTTTTPTAAPGALIITAGGAQSVLQSLSWLLSLPLWCLFLGSMCSFFMQRGLSDWAGDD